MDARLGPADERASGRPGTRVASGRLAGPWWLAEAMGGTLRPEETLAAA